MRPPRRPPRPPGREVLRGRGRRLVTVRVDPWNFGSKILLIGDSAHAVVPFYGQGMNAAFEDVYELVRTIEESGDDLATAVPKFARERQPRGDGIRTLSMNNYREMAHHAGSAMFRARKKVEGWLHMLFPSRWIPLYKMVAFTSTPYDEAIATAHVQDVRFGMGTFVATFAATFAATRLAYPAIEAATGWTTSHAELVTNTVSPMLHPKLAIPAIVAGLVGAGVRRAVME